MFPQLSGSVSPSITLLPRGWSAVLENERANPWGPGADGGGGAGARERDGCAAARQDRGEDV